MRPTKEQYDTAIANLELAKQQLTPDGKSCAICGDTGHFAWECGHNPLLAVDICKGIADGSDALHEQLHYLAGYQTRFGQQLGPASIQSLAEPAPGYVVE